MVMQGSSPAPSDMAPCSLVPPMPVAHAAMMSPTVMKGVVMHKGAVPVTVSMDAAVLMEVRMPMMSDVMAVRLGSTAADQESKNARQNPYKSANHYASLQRQRSEATRLVYQELKRGSSTRSSYRSSQSSGFHHWGLGERRGRITQAATQRATTTRNTTLSIVRFPAVNV